MHRILVVPAFLGAIAVAASLPTTKPEQSGMSTERLKHLSVAMRAYIDHRDVPGTVTLVARRGHIVHLEAQGMADIEA